MLDLNDLYFFVQVVDRRGFTAASKALGVPKSNLSRRILKLEKDLGVRLIQRSSRRFVVTEIGTEFYEHCRAMTIEAEEAENAVRRRLAEPAGRVRFSCPVVLGQHAVADLLPRFMQAYPKIQIIEHLTSSPMDLFGEGLDLALRVHGRPLESSDLIQRSVCRIQLILVASPRLLDRIGRPHDPNALQGSVGLARDIFPDEATWNLEHESGRKAAIAFKPALCSNDWFTLRKLAAAGHGIVALPAHVCRDALAGGELECVLPEWRSEHAALTLLTPTRRGTLPAVRTFIDFLLRELPPVVAWTAERPSAPAALTIR
jgi:DNA-binding transcriptional LysR family regulator